MSLSQVRTFLKQQIKIIAPDLKEWTDAFNIENIPSTLIETMYHIDYGRITVTRQSGGIIDDSVSCTVKVFKKGYENTSDSQDEILDIANCIRLKVVDPKAIFTNNIIAAQSVSIFPDKINDTNDNTIVVSIEFNLLLSFDNT